MKTKNKNISKKCPTCKALMHIAGKLRPAVNKGRARLIIVYVCSRCGYRALD